MEITLRDKTYPILFSLAAMEEIQKRYQGLGELKRMLESPGEIAWVLSLIINEGLKLQAYEYGIPAKKVSAEQISLLLTPTDLADGPLLDGVVAALNEGLGGEKNLEAGELMKVGKKILNL